MVGAGGVAVRMMAGAVQAHCFDVGSSAVVEGWVVVGVESFERGEASGGCASTFLTNSHGQFLEGRGESA